MINRVPMLALVASLMNIAILNTTAYATARYRAVENAAQFDSLHRGGRVRWTGWSGAGWGFVGPGGGRGWMGDGWGWRGVGSHIAPIYVSRTRICSPPCWY